MEPRLEERLERLKPGLEERSLGERLKPEIKKAIYFVEQNKTYLSSEGILAGETTIKLILKDFYDLKQYLPMGFDSIEDLNLNSNLCPGNENKEKYGKTPDKLLELLAHIPGKSVNNSSNFIYETVRESLKEKQTIHQSNESLQLLSYFTGPILTLGIVLGSISGHFNSLWASIPLAVDLDFLFLYTAGKREKDFTKFLATKSGEIYKDFLDLESKAYEADRYVKTYRRLFD